MNPSTVRATTGLPGRPGQPARCQVLLVSAIASGHGKTLVTAALARLHSRAGRRVRVFKCGPDFLDPHWHQLASGAPVQSLDLWMTGEADIAQRLHQAASEADLILIEGVMGLFDGPPSAADLALRFDLPVIAVLQVGAMAQTTAAVAHGLKHFRTGLRWAGVLCNGVASAHHAALLQAALADAQDWLGTVPRLQAGAADGAPARTKAAAAFLPERHLGLVAAAELPDAMARLDQAADALAGTALAPQSAFWQRTDTAFQAPAEPLAQPSSATAALRGRTIAVASDAAFAFIYPANLQWLQAMGATVRLFAPLAGDALPACDAVWLPGGYPELHAPALAANTALRKALAAHVAQGKPLWAECGGMVALCNSVQQRDGTVQPLWGLLPARAVMQPRLAGLGHQQLAWPGSDVAPLRGHTFHYSRLDTELPVWTSTAAPPERVGRPGEAVYRHGSMRASYFHAWFPSSPVLAARLLGGD